MPSAMKQTSTVRKRKARRGGRQRKNALENTGSTLSKAELFKVK